MLSRIQLLLLVTFALAPLTGCLSRQVARDGNHLRQAVNDMYTDQIMDNLIRAHDYLPFAQLTYGDVTVLDNDQLTGNIGESHSLTEELLAAPSRVWMNAFSTSAAAARSRTMSFVANPVTDQNDIYEAYQKFAHDPELFIMSDCDPGCAAHIVRKCCERYYWVPVDAAPQFLELAMNTTFMRGPEAAISGAYEVTVTRLSEPVLTKNPKKPDEITVQVFLSSPVPNGSATMVAKLHDGRTMKIPLQRVETVKKDGEDKKVQEGEDTTELGLLPWSPKEKGYTEQDLIGAKARIYSDKFPADAPVPAARTIQKINGNLNFLKNQPARVLNR